MIWDDLIGQAPAKAYLRATLAARRLAHGCLFTGPAGVGKRTAAYAFAQTVLCHNPPSPDTPCGECKSCRWFAARSGAHINHPDMINLLTVKITGEEDGRPVRSEKLVGDHEPVIRLEAVQYVCEQLHRSPMAGTKRAVIIPEAQRLCRGQAESANAFLKTLEEPPAASLIILTSSQPEALLETIVSRVQNVQFKRLASADVATGLKRRWPGMEDNDVNLVAAMSDGSIGRALELVGGDLKKWRAAVIAGLEKFNAQSFLLFGTGLWTIAESEGQRLYDLEKNAGKIAEEDDESESDSARSEVAGQGSTAAEDEAAKTAVGWKRHVFTRMLSLCEICFRDGLVSAAAEGAPSAPLLQPDRPDFARALGVKFGTEGCEKALRALRDALLAARLYVRGDVIARALAGTLREALIA
ncbi:MAG TPA: DNA polymerase III subunit [Planctomycetota bacterium]|nr:DNA polymerase III subunit [Planctomycetota bacterium]